MPSGDWRFTWVDPSGSMQNPLCSRADPLKPSIAIGPVPDNKPTHANLGASLIYDPLLREIRVDFTGYALTSSVPVNTSQLTNDAGFLVSSDLSGYALTGTVNTQLAAKLDVTTAASAYQPLDSDLTSIAALSTTAFGRNLLTLADAAAGRTAWGLGTAATLNSTALATAAQGAKADTALQSINSAIVLSALGYTPYNGGTNPSGFLTGITGVQVTTALGFTPYNGATNPNGYLTSINSSQIAIALGYTPYSSSNPSNFVNQSGARGAITLTTTGTGAASYDSATGVINVPTPAASKRQETYSGTTNASGVYTVTFASAYPVAPNIQAGLINVADNQNLRVTAISTTGFTVLARNRVDVVGLLPSWTNVSGIGVDVLITAK